MHKNYIQTLKTTIFLLSDNNRLILIYDLKIIYIHYCLFLKYFLVPIQEPEFKKTSPFLYAGLDIQTSLNFVPIPHTGFWRPLYVPEVEAQIHILCAPTHLGLQIDVSLITCQRKMFPQCCNKHSTDNWDNSVNSKSQEAENKQQSSTQAKAENSIDSLVQQVLQE